MRTFVVVVPEILLQICLHLFDCLVPGCTALNPEVLVKKGPVQSLNKAVALRPPNLRGAMFDALQLQEELVRVLVGPAAELATVIAEDGGDPRFMLLEEGQNILVQNMDGGNRKLVGVEPAPSKAGMAIEDALKVDLADAFERADEEGIDRNKITCMACFDMPLPEFWAEALQQFHLVV